MPIPIFGPDWTKQNTRFTASDDRVRGGSSQSHLEIKLDSGGEYALFKGVLDTKTLGGAGFTSQRTVETDRTWDLCVADGVFLDILEGDGKQYTLTVSNEIGSNRPDGRASSTILYEYNFTTHPGRSLQQYIPWKDFKPMYRGRPKEDAPPLDTARIRRWSFMIRSFFDAQDGEFQLCLRCVCGYLKGEDN